MSDQNLTDWRKLALKLEAEINKVILGQELLLGLSQMRFLLEVMFYSKVM
jgi:hypothetical protein